MFKAGSEERNSNITTVTNKINIYVLVLCARSDFACEDEACRPFCHKGWVVVEHSFEKWLVTHPGNIRDMVTVLPLLLLVLQSATN